MPRAHRAKVFKNGGSQAIRLPRECRFDTEEVLIRKEGARLVIEPAKRRHSQPFLNMILGEPDESMPPRDQSKRRDKRADLDR